MKGISLFILLFLLLPCFAQDESADDGKIKFVGSTHLIGSYYHLGSYSKERPLGFIEQSFEIVASPNYWFGIGTGFNLYPGTAVVPIYVSSRYVKDFNPKWGMHILQSYGRNIKMGNLGFNSNRLYGDIGARYSFKELLGINFGMGYLFNWDRWGGMSLSFTGSVGIYYGL
ncbi:MAG: hypothetical protein R2780_14830 [Crocinitomicaceae bacterium]|nr:hypothetical protein [Crocinitomicaceae bacterium]